MKKEKFIIEGTVLKKYNGNEKEVVIPEGITEIGYDAFRGNKGLMEVWIPKSVECINNGAFSYCKYLTTIHVYNSLAIIRNAFYSCESLRDIVFFGNIEEWNAIQKSVNWKDTYSNSITIWFYGTEEKITIEN